MKRNANPVSNRLDLGAYGVILVIATSLLSACMVSPRLLGSTVAPVLRAAEPAGQVAPQQEKAVRERQLRTLLALAQQALADDRLRSPRDDNAYDWYQQVLAIDELNAEAHWGMQQITARYLALAEQAFGSGRLEVAEQMLFGAEQVAATPAQARALRDKFRQQFSDNEFRLDTTALSARNQSAQQQLTALARTLTAQQRLLIVARNDTEGRWIYQQMRTAIDGFRLRGNIELGRVPRVIVIDM